jgi:hypothetical protein
MTQKKLSQIANDALRIGAATAVVKRQIALGRYAQASTPHPTQGGRRARRPSPAGWGQRVAREVSERTRSGQLSPVA